MGYDKGADALKFMTHTWTAPTMPTTRPLLYANIVGTLDHELKAKGLTRTESDGDLVLTPAGGMEFGLKVAVGTPILPTYWGLPDHRCDHVDGSSRALKPYGSIRPRRDTGTHFC